MSSVMKARGRSVPTVLSRELSSAVGTGGPRPATVLVTGGHAPTARISVDPSASTSALHTSSSSSPSDLASMPALRPDELAQIVREAGFSPHMAATIAAVCAYRPLQQALWDSIQANSEREGTDLAEGVLASITKGTVASGLDLQSYSRELQDMNKGKERDRTALGEDAEEEEEVDASFNLRDYDHYKLRTHSFVEYRSEQDISSLLQVDPEDDVSSVTCDEPRRAETWDVAALRAVWSDTRSREEVHLGRRGHAGEPGASEAADPSVFGVVLIVAVCVVSLGFLWVKNPSLYRVALQSEFVRAVAALSSSFAQA